MPNYDPSLTMTFKDLILKRQSVRKYKQEPVPTESIAACIEAARLAPSACNSQSWKYIVVDEEVLLQKVAKSAEGMGMNSFFSQVPCIVAVVQEKPNATSAIGSRIKNKDFSLIDIGISVEHFCLQAAELGIGTCIVGWFDEEKVRQLLKVPENLRIPLLITVGFGDDEPRVKDRKPTDQIYGKNCY